MPSATESMIANQAIGKIHEVTAPYNPSAIEGLNGRFNYARPEQRIYDGKSVVDSVVADVKYSTEKSRESYVKDSITGIQRENIYTSAIRNQQQTGLYDKLMSGFYKN